MYTKILYEKAAKFVASSKGAIKFIKREQGGKWKVSNDLRKQGWRSGDSAVASHLCGPSSIPTFCHMWFEFVVGSCPYSEGFSPVRFPSL